MVLCGAVGFFISRAIAPYPKSEISRLESLIDMEQYRQAVKEKAVAQ
jgi:hypothetical protein